MAEAESETTIDFDIDEAITSEPSDFEEIARLEKIMEPSSDMKDMTIEAIEAEIAQITADLEDENKSYNYQFFRGGHDNWQNCYTRIYVLRLRLASLQKARASELELKY
jgi:hypothetical protein